MQRRAFIKRLATVLGGLGLATFGGGCSKERGEPGPVIAISSGRLQGTKADGIHRFLGIPFAEPPFAENRFLPPVPRRSWDGVRPASEYGPICPQTGGISMGLPAEGEDCLNLNVWTPDPAARNLPVMVWAHGGGQVSGAGSAPLYDGAHFAREGVVLVANNRRLGAEGYLYLPEHFGDGIGPGNLGILDQIEVLRWVQENIEKFGGDPNNVTLFGESGGGAATQAVVATRQSQGLLHKVIPQSGGHAAQRPETATEISAHILKQLAIKPGDIDALRRVPWPDLVKQYRGLRELGLGQPQIYLPVLSESMPVHPADAAHEGFGLELDYLIGTCRDEMNLFAALMWNLEGSNFDKRARQVLAQSDTDWNGLAQAYREASPELDAEAADKAIMGDMWFRAPSLRIAEGHADHGNANTFMYLFTWESQLLGAAHGMDLMVFGNGLPFEILLGFASFDRTAQFMRRAWTNFARHGNPGTSAFAWPKYDTATRRTVSLNEEASVLQDPYRLQRGALGKLLTQNWEGMGL